MGPVAGPKARSGKQNVAVQVAPVTKMKQQMRKSGHLEHRRTFTQTGEEEGDRIGYSKVAGPLGMGR